MDDGRLHEKRFVVLHVDDHTMIEPVLAKSRDLMKSIGDCGDEYR